MRQFAALLQERLCKHSFRQLSKFAGAFSAAFRMQLTEEIKWCFKTWTIDPIKNLNPLRIFPQSYYPFCFFWLQAVLLRMAVDGLSLLLDQLTTQCRQLLSYPCLAEVFISVCPLLSEPWNFPKEFHPVTFLLAVPSPTSSPHNTEGWDRADVTPVVLWIHFCMWQCDTCRIHLQSCASMSHTVTQTFLGSVTSRSFVRGATFMGKKKNAGGRRWKGNWAIKTAEYRNEVYWCGKKWGRMRCKNNVSTHRSKECVRCREKCVCSYTLFNLCIHTGGCLALNVAQHCI